jgi:hypothetical protein
MQIRRKLVLKMSPKLNEIIVVYDDDDFDIDGEEFDHDDVDDDADTHKEVPNLTNGLHTSSLSRSRQIRGWTVKTLVVTGIVLAVFVFISIYQHISCLTKQVNSLSNELTVQISLLNETRNQYHDVLEHNGLLRKQLFDERERIERREKQFTVQKIVLLTLISSIQSNLKTKSHICKTSIATLTRMLRMSAFITNVKGDDDDDDYIYSNNVEYNNLKATIRYIDRVVTEDDVESSNDLLVWGCWILNNLAQYKEYQKLIISSGGLSLLSKIVENYRQDENPYEEDFVHEKAKETMQILTEPKRRQDDNAVAVSQGNNDYSKAAAFLERGVSYYLLYRIGTGIWNYYLGWVYPM